ncbi:class I SAM-dependent methyltransferase [Kitasatospora sp. NPDC101183]|uniref:class I SAM-dependent methyltransferase n=1 Tax=Kitasatospora sp. NPDC101183 TaxID=3364100 RepID=UPI00381026BE
MSERARSFGSIAEAYERYRPGYPDELYARVAAYAGRPLRTALEIGAGTGKATRLFAAHGVAVTATDPDPAMLAELRRNVPSSVQVEQGAFEELELGGRQFGLMYAAAALHWTDPAGRWDRVAALVEPGGVFASFGGPIVLADRELAEAVRAARAPYLESDDLPSPDGTPRGREMQWPGTELEASEWFEDVQQEVVERRLSVSAEEYIGHLSTVSAYIMLPAEQRREAFARVRQVLPERVEVDGEITAHLARRRDRA